MQEQDLLRKLTWVNLFISDKTNIIKDLYNFHQVGCRLNEVHCIGEVESLKSELSINNPFKIFI